MNNIHVVNSSDFGIDKRIGLIEDKNSVLDFHQISQEFLETSGMDSRLLTTLFNSAHPDFDFLIGVHDIEQFFSDLEMANGVIAHEIGHIIYGPALGNPEENLKVELECDEFAALSGHAKGLTRYLEMGYDVFKDYAPLESILSARLMQLKQTV